jgi:hypothetical protein
MPTKMAYSKQILAPEILNIFAVIFHMADSVLICTLYGH